MSPEAALLVSQANGLFLFCTETAAAVQRRATEYRDNKARAIPEQQRWYSAEHSVPAVLPLRPRPNLRLVVDNTRLGRPPDEREPERAQRGESRR